MPSLRFAFLLAVVPAFLGPARAAVTPDARPDPDHTHWIYSLLPKAMQSNPELEQTVITEVTDAGKKLAAVTPTAPAYYQPHSTGAKEIGAAYGGTHPLKVEELETALFRALAAQGYLPGKLPEHPPTLVIVYGWGAHNMLVENDPDNPVLSPQQMMRNILDRAALVGGDKFARQLLQLFREADAMGTGANAQLATDGQPPMPPGMLAFANPVNVYKLKNPKNAFLVDQTASDVYYVVVSAYDYATVAANNPVLLWRTRMTVGAQGVSQQISLPTLMQTAGPYFGKEMEGPEIVLKRANVRTGRVDVGTPTVVEPVPQAAPPPAKK